MSKTYSTVTKRNSSHLLNTQNTPTRGSDPIRKNVKEQPIEKLMSFVQSVPVADSSKDDGDDVKTMFQSILKQIENLDKIDDLKQMMKDMRYDLLTTENEVAESKDENMKIKRELATVKEGLNDQKTINKKIEKKSLMSRQGL